MRRSAPALALAAALCGCASLEPAAPADVPPADYAPGPAASRLSDDERAGVALEALEAARFIEPRRGARSAATGARAVEAGIALTMKDRTGAGVQEYVYRRGAPAPHLKSLDTKGWTIVRLPPFYVERGLTNAKLRPAFRGELEATFDEKQAAAARALVDALAPLAARAPAAPAAAEAAAPLAVALSTPAFAPAPDPEAARAELARLLREARAIDLGDGGRWKVREVAPREGGLELSLRDAFGAGRRSYLLRLGAEPPKLDGASVVLPDATLRLASADDARRVAELLRSR